MRAFLLRRLAQSAVAVFGITLIVFVVIRLSGDPTLLLLGPDASEAQHAALRAQLGLDRPIPVQYLQFLEQAVHGNLGRSIRSDQPVVPLVLEHLPATLELTVSAMLLAIVVGVPAGVAAAVWRGSILDRIVGAGSVFGQSIPLFWLGMMLILIFAVQLRVLPVGGRGGIDHVVLPAVSLAVYFAAALSRLTRSSMLGALSSDYVRFARMKGVPPWLAVWRHAFRNAANPIISLIGLDFATLLGGAVVTETVFAWPGVGQLAVDSIFARDFPVVQAVTLLTSVVFVLVNLITDVAYGWLDPRIRLGGRGRA